LLSARLRRRPEAPVRNRTAAPTLSLADAPKAGGAVVSKKREIEKANQTLATLFTKHLYWNGSTDEAAHLLNILALRYGVIRVPFGNFCDNSKFATKTWTEGLLELLLAIAADHYPAFKKPSRVGRRRRSTWNPLAEWPQAHEARLVQLFDLTKKAREKTGKSVRLDDVAKAIVDDLNGGYTEWKYNGLRSASSLVRLGWDKIPPEIKRDPLQFLPPDGQEPHLFGKPYLPPLPGRRAQRR
jgi:hypothetical protein